MSLFSHPLRHHPHNHTGLVDTVLSSLEALTSEFSIPFAFACSYPGLETRVLTIYLFVPITLFTLDFQFHLLARSKNIPSETERNDCQSKSPGPTSAGGWPGASQANSLSSTQVMKPPLKPGDGAVTLTSFLPPTVFVNFNSSSACRRRRKPDPTGHVWLLDVFSLAFNSRCSEMFLISCQHLQTGTYVQISRLREPHEKSEGPDTLGLHF